MDNYEVSVKLEQIRHLLFFMGNSFDSVQNRTLKYRAQEKDSACRLAYEIDRNIDELVTLQSILFDKVAELEKNFEE